MPYPAFLNVRILLIAVMLMAVVACSDDDGGVNNSHDAQAPDASGPPQCEVGTDNGTPGVGECLADIEVTCDDGVDNDVDGVMDCEDTDCAGVIAEPGACLDASDLAIYADLDGNVEWNKCVPSPPDGQGCMIDEECNTQCFHDNTGLSEPCSRCFAQAVSCLILNCATVCGSGGGTPACSQCVFDNCSTAHQDCFGHFVCAYEYGCRDTFDNDSDGFTDAEDPDCAG